MAKGLINRFAISFVDANRKEVLSKYPTDTEYVKDFSVSDEMLSSLYKMAEEEGIDFEKEQAETSAPLFKMLLKALIGRDIYDNATYFKVYNQYDPIFTEAYRLINSEDYNRLLSPQN